MFSSSIPFPRYQAFLQSFAFTGAQMIWVALYLSMGERMGLSPAQVLVSFAVGSVFFLIGSPYWANKSESWGRQQVLRIGMSALWCSYAGLIALCLWPPSSPHLTFALLILARCVYGLIASGIPAVAQAVHNDHTTIETSSQAMISHSLSLNVGRIAGLSIVVFFSGDLEKSLLTFFGILSLILFFSFFPTKSSSKILSQNMESSQLRRTWRDEFFQIRWLLGLAFIFSAFAEAINSSLALSIKTALSITAHQSSAFTARLLLFACVGVAVMQLSNRFLLLRFKRIYHFYIGILALILGIFSFSTSTTALHFWWAIGFFIIGLALIPPYYMSLLRSSKGDSHYGKRAGLLSAAHTIGSTFGISAAALAASLHSVSVVIALLFTMVILMAVFNGLHSVKMSFWTLKKSASDPQ